MIKRSAIKALSRKDVTFGFPTNFVPTPILNLATINGGSDVRLIWKVDPAFSTNVKYFEVYLDGDYYADVTDYTTVYQTLAPSTEYDFKVRGIGYHGEIGTFSNEETVVGGALPILYLEGSFYEHLGMSIWWTDILDNEDYNILGYDVYYADTPDITNLGSMTKLTDSLISFTAYTKFVETFEDQISTMAVTFDYEV